MAELKSFGVIGGDKRQKAMANSMALDGYNVFLAGFDDLEICNIIQNVSFEQAIGCSDYIVLPLPVTKDGRTINAPFTSDEMIINKDFINKLIDKKIFCGMADRLYDISDEFLGLDLNDYSKREEFAIMNAVPTAEGAIEIAMREYDGTINGSRCLVAGFGRIGKVLSKMLKGLGAKVTVSARKKEDMAWISLMGYDFVNTSEIKRTNGYDIVFNTVPSMIFDAYTLAKAACNSVLIDLASAPGGVDYDAANRLGIKSIKALSLPGKVAYKSAGEIIKKTIYNMIEEGAK